MSLQTQSSISFIKAINEAAGRRFDGSDALGYGCSYDGSAFSKRDYVLDYSVSKNWTAEKSRELRKRLKEVGAINIIGRVKKACSRNYLDLAFDIDPNRLAEYLAKDEETRIADEKYNRELAAKFEAERKAYKKAERAAKKAAKAAEEAETKSFNGVKII